MSPNDPRYQSYLNAKQGIVIPRGWPNGHNDPEAHVLGNTNSVFTSWSSDPRVARIYAGSGGVFLTGRFRRSEIINMSHLAGDEQEMLIVGPRSGLMHTIVP